MSKWKGVVLVLAAYIGIVAMLMGVGYMQDAAQADDKAGMIFKLKATGPGSRELLEGGEEGVYRCGTYMRIRGQVFRPFFNFGEGTVRFTRVALGYCKEGFTMGEQR